MSFIDRGPERLLLRGPKGPFLKAILFTVILLPLSCADTPTEALPQTFGESLQVTLNEAFSETNGVGVSVSVLIPGEPEWKGSVGVSHGAHPITPQSVFAAGSITKTFTALTILRLAEEGLLSVDDSLHAWFPPYPHVDPDITIRQLLNHTSGLSDFVDQPGWFQWVYSDPDRIWEMEEFFLATVAPPYFEKGTQWSYSSTGYLLLRMIIEKATGSSVADQYRTHILEPLGLSSTFTVPGDPLPSTWAHGWFELTGDGAYDDFSYLDNTAFCTAAGGQVYSTASDLAKLGRAIMHDRSILQESSYEEMKDFVYPLGHDEPMVKGYGLGLMSFDESFTFGHEVWGHGGNAPGYAAGMLYLPDYSVVVGIMDNTEEGEAMEVLGPILDAILEHLQGS